MRAPNHVTFTGVDDRTSIRLLEGLSQRYPIEWAILFSPTRQGTEPRYPSLTTATAVLDSQFLQVAAHLCGGYARTIIQGKAPEWGLDPWRFARIQVNHVDPNPYRIREFGRRFSVPMIAQSRDPNAFPTYDGITWLFDRSGGRGTVPDRWPVHPGPGYTVGYAGGITPDNVLGVVFAVDAPGPYWLDMETGIRTDDQFDVAKCQRVCEQLWPER